MESEDEERAKEDVEETNGENSCVEGCLGCLASKREDIGEIGPRLSG